MSKKNTNKETPSQESRVMTKYDRKMQAYQEQEKKAKAQKQWGNLMGIAIVVIVAAFVLSFPIRNYMAVNGTYITVGGEKVTKVEFDYHYAMAKTSFLAQSSYYLSMMGMDASNIDNQMYSTDLTFRDYFEQQAVHNLQNVKAMKAEAQASGFTYNTDEEYAQTLEELESSAAENNMSLNKFLRSMFGSYATKSRLEKVIREGIWTTAYYEQIEDASGPSDTEIDSYYEENSDNYDVVDYHMTIVEAELPTAAPDGTPTLDEEGNEVAYQPTEEETAAAMEEARKTAETAEATIMAGGDPYEAQSYSYTNSLISGWLFDKARAKGDSTVVEDSTNHRYLVAGFDRRYRQETPTVDARVIATMSTDAQSILAEWQNGPATEESFIELCGQYGENTVEGGLYEGLNTSGLSEEINAWLGDADRKAGDTAAFTEENGSNYVFYYVGVNDPVWKLSIHDLLLNRTMLDYLDRISENMTVEDPKGNLNYLKVEAAASEAAQQQESEQGQESFGDSAEASSDSEENPQDTAEASADSEENP